MQEYLKAGVGISIACASGRCLFPFLEAMVVQLAAHYGRKLLL